MLPGGLGTRRTGLGLPGAEHPLPPSSSLQRERRAGGTHSSLHRGPVLGTAAQGCERGPGGPTSAQRALPHCQSSGHGCPPVPAVTRTDGVPGSAATNMARSPWTAREAGPERPCPQRPDDALAGDNLGRRERAGSSKPWLVESNPRGPRQGSVFRSATEDRGLRVWCTGAL